MNNKPNTITAELFLSQLEDAEHQTDVFYEQKHCEKAMIEFAKHHVKLALEAANKKTIPAFVLTNNYDLGNAIQQTILTAYPETNII